MCTVTVVIPTYNCGEYLPYAIESVIDQLYKPLEIIVVDDGSTDNTRQVLSKYSNHINYIYQHNRGVSSARNTGINAASGKFVALLDADDFWTRDKLLKQVELFEKASDNVAYISTGAARLINGKIVYNDNKYHNDRINLSVEDFLRYGRTPINTILFRLKDAIEVGGFDESLMWKEDWDFLVRLSVGVGKGRMYIPEDLAVYRIHGGQTTMNCTRYQNNDGIRSVEKNKKIIVSQPNGRVIYNGIMSSLYHLRAYSARYNSRFNSICWAVMSIAFDSSLELSCNLKLIIRALIGSYLYGKLKLLTKSNVYG